MLFESFEDVGLQGFHRKKKGGRKSISRAKRRIQISYTYLGLQGRVANGCCSVESFWFFLLGHGTDCLFFAVQINKNKAP